MSGKERENRQVFIHWQTVDRLDAEVTLSGRLFQTDRLATRKARLLTVDSLKDGTSR